MKKAIMLSIRPKWVRKILNGEKTIEVRKKFPKEYKGWVYIYCTKNGGWCIVGTNGNKTYYHDYDNYTIPYNYIGNGRVVARFWCDKVEEIKNKPFVNNPIRFTETLGETKLCQKSCLTTYDLQDYLQDKNGYAIHISKLEISAVPKELSEFYGYTKRYEVFSDLLLPVKLNKAPQNYCYVMEEESL